MSDTVTLPRELAERIRRMCVPIKADVDAYNELVAALAAPQTDEVIRAHAKLAQKTLALESLKKQFDSQCRITASALEERAAFAAPQPKGLFIDMIAAEGPDFVAEMAAIGEPQQDYKLVPVKLTQKMNAALNDRLTDHWYGCAQHVWDILLDGGDKPEPQPVKQDDDFAIRGELTKLKCWHRLTELEANELVSFFGMLKVREAK